MKSKWLWKNNSDKLIVFFNGWGLDENVIKHLMSADSDVLMFYDYANLEIGEEVSSEIERYSEINVICWSFGVWAFSKVFERFSLAKKIIAINGTPIPIDKRFGIPEKIFNLTLTTLSEKAFDVFFQNMFLGFEPSFLNGCSVRSLDNVREELTQIQQLSCNVDEYKKKYRFNKIIISDNDKIIPTKNQLNYWQNEYEKQTDDFCIKTINSGHCIFNVFNSWEAIVDYE